MNLRLRYPVPALLLIALAGCKSPPAPAGDDAEKAAETTISVEVATAAPRPMQQLLDLSGAFAPAQGTAARLTPAVPGRIAKILVREGDRVSAGQLLATIDQRVQTAQQSSAAASLAASEAQSAQSKIAYQSAVADQSNLVRSAEIGLEQAQLERESGIAQAALAYEEAKADLDKLRAGARPQEISQAHEATVQARATRDRAVSEYRRNQELAPDGYVSKRQVEDAKTARDSAESALKAASANESLVKAGARPEEIRAQEAHTAALKEALASAHSIGDKRVATAKLAYQQAQQAILSVQAKLKDVESSAATARQRQADLASASATTALNEIRAPYDGVISRRNLNPGDFADTTSPLLEITALKAHQDFVASALPTQASQARVGMDVLVDFQSSQIHGRVISLSPADAQTGLATVRISCDKPAFSGAYSTAHIVLHDYASVVTVPSKSVLDRDGKTIVYRVVDSVAKQTEVVAGPENDGFTAILSGVKQGDVVVQLGSYELADGSKVKVATPEKPAPESGAPEKKESGS